ncbi:recombinase family protein [Amycolatopsis samaneae]|uniref:Recombinase family protein n=1 Tax=Amycolatopsis samaneae TaxID=664691 RepID=A0ABW5GIB0_9PSEU
MKLAVAYLRVSTKDQAEKGGQAEGFSIPAQREALQRKAQNLGAGIAAEFVDAGESAKSADRPDLQRMLVYLIEHRVDYVLVHKVDRLARNRVDDIAITMAIKKSGAQLVSATENIDETPSGMLLHGIMSSIAEFYSHNLATEVHKGMSQKAKTGGTPGKVPIGYFNVGRMTPEGREERTVVVDPDRAPLISWAFTAFATGEWTIRLLADELERRGLRSRQTPKVASRPVRPNVLQSILTNPYYKGMVVYRGVTHPGRHTPLADVSTWQQVQDVLSAHAVGEKQRSHRHYLKSSILCGDCGSRLIVSMAKNRYGTVYPYFSCLGRHEKRTRCTRKAMLISLVEKIVEDHWATIQLDRTTRDQLEVNLREILSEQRQELTLERKLLEETRRALVAKQDRLIEAVYSGAFPMDRIGREQTEVGRQLADVEQRLASAHADDARAERHLATVLEFLPDCHNVYVAAGPLERRLLNQAMFTCLYIEEEQVRPVYAKPFDTLLGSMGTAEPKGNQPDEGASQVSMAEILQRYQVADSNGPANDFLFQSDLRRAAKNASFKPLTSMEKPRLPVGSPPDRNSSGGFSCQPCTLIEQLSNPRPQLLRLLDFYENEGSIAQRLRSNSSKVTMSPESDKDSGMKRSLVRPNHRLSSHNTEVLIRAHDAGAPQSQLASQFHIHRTTVKRHVVRRRHQLKLGHSAVRRLISY